MLPEQPQEVSKWPLDQENAAIASLAQGSDNESAHCPLRRETEQTDRTEETIKTNVTRKTGETGYTDSSAGAGPSNRKVNPRLGVPGQGNVEGAIQPFKPHRLVKYIRLLLNL